MRLFVLVGGVSSLLIGCAVALSVPPDVDTFGMIEIAEVSDAALAPVTAKAQEFVDAGANTLTFRINSFGGSVFSGFAFIQAMEEHQKAGIRIKCAVDITAMSMGFAILQSICDERMMTKRSMLLAHNASSGVEGTAADMDEAAAFIHAMDNGLAEMCAARLNISVDEYKRRVDKKDWTMSWQEALAVGAVDSIVDPKDLPPLVKIVVEPTFLFSL